MIMVVKLQTLPRILFHVNRRLNHVSVGVQEVAAHQQSELFWRFHLQNMYRRWRKPVCSSETLPLTYTNTHPPTTYYPSTYLPDYRVAENRSPWYDRTHTKLESREAFTLVSSFLFNDVLSAVEVTAYSTLLDKPPVTQPDLSLQCSQNPNNRPYPQPEASSSPSYTQSVFNSRSSHLLIYTSAT